MSFWHICFLTYTIWTVQCFGHASKVYDEHIQWCGREMYEIVHGWFECIWRVFRCLFIKLRSCSSKMHWEGSCAQLGKVSFCIVLGHIVSEIGIEVNQSKIELISKLPTLKCVKNVHSFLRHARFYKRFIPNFSAISIPWCNLLEKDATFYWTQKYIDVFRILVAKLTSAPIIQSPDWSLPFEIMCDLRNFALGPSFAKEWKRDRSMYITKEEL